MNDNLRQLQQADDEAFARRLLDAMPAVRRCFAGLSPAMQAPTGRPPVRPDQAQGVTEQSQHTRRHEAETMTANAEATA